MKISPSTQYYSILANIGQYWRILASANAGIVLTLIVFLYVVGNKNDDPENKVVLTEDAQQFADQMGIDLFETSAKENINVEEVNCKRCLFIEPLAVSDLPGCLGVQRPDSRNFPKIFSKDLMI